MKILIATPISPPRVGGPSEYVRNIATKLRKKGIEVETISYNKFKKIPQPLKLCCYFSELFRKSRGSQIIYAFNIISCGVPACLISKILKKRFFLRLGGDFLWERAVEQERTKKPVREYYKEPKSLKEKFLMSVIKKVLNGTDKIIFTSNFQKGIYKKYFDINEEKTAVIPNPFPEIKRINSGLSISNYQLLYAGRLIKLKNLDTLIEVFVKVLKETDGPLILKIIGDGPEKESLKLQIENLKLKNKIIFEKPIPHQKLLKEIQKSYLCLLPSLTEISPNFALECIKLGKPILLTKETGIYNEFKNHLIFIDPQDSKDLEQKILYLLDRENYQSYLQKIKNIPTSYSWDDVIEKHISLFKELI